MAISNLICLWGTGAGNTTVTYVIALSKLFSIVATPAASAGTMTGMCIESATTTTAKLHPCYRTGDKQGVTTVQCCYLAWGC